LVKRGSTPKKRGHHNQGEIRRKGKGGTVGKVQVGETAIKTNGGGGVGYETPIMVRWGGGTGDREKIKKRGASTKTKDCWLKTVTHLYRGNAPVGGGGKKDAGNVGKRDYGGGGILNVGAPMPAAKTLEKPGGKKKGIRPGARF